MYNKIAPIILNAGKNASFSDVYVAQPDSLKENLAGKIFILAEINAKKNEGRQVFNFLIEALDNYYYNDEKILLKDKIEGLKLENIFEAALSKVNKDLSEFLSEEKIKINVSSTNITIGVIFENKLYFSSLGKNHALLIYRRNEQYEVINVETSATDIKEHRENEDYSASRETNIFSSVISGEIPINSYFFFVSEALPEYLSNKELISIITKLPPIVAAEQIKNTLEKINTYVPFLGVLVKNTIGLNMVESKEELEEILTTASPTPTLNSTEQRTEQILSPAGLINLGRIVKRTKDIFGPRPNYKSPNLKKSFKPEEDKISVPLPINIDRVKSLNLARSDSFLVKEKLFFKKKPGEFLIKLKNIGIIIGQIFNPANWLALVVKARDWFKSLNSKNSLLFGGLILVVIIFFGSLIFTNLNHKRQAAQNAFNNIAAEITKQEDSIDQFFLYNNEDGARAALLAAQSLINSLPHEKSGEKTVYNNLNSRLMAQAERIQKLIKVGSAEKTNDLTGLNLNSIFLIGGNIYASDDKNIYSLTINSSSLTKYTISGASSIVKPYRNPNDKNNLYYLNNNQIVKFDLKNKKSSLISISGIDSSVLLNAYSIYANNFYFVDKNTNQIYRLIKDRARVFANKSERIKEQEDFSQATDFAIDEKGAMYILKNNGEILKFMDGKRENFNAPALAPAVNQVGKIFIGVKYIYLFDSAAKRLAVLNKSNGNLLNQYEVASLNNLKDFTVSEEGKIAYFLAEGGIYRINLKQ